MPRPIIQVEGISKQYRLGELSTGTLSHDLNRWWARWRGRPDPYRSLTQVNLRQQAAAVEGLEYVWALRDINFEVPEGSVLGVIGRNGAGKSTLLKILSRITAPTEGVVRIGGRISALLEVGTGFHGDLTGRENVYLNGAVLGMTRAEIRSRLDEIVAFSGCERYLDTPVKRYSSGMVVRLGFAVAAHLEPEILIVDEVLAVGDAEFQKKCIGKMHDVAGRGRTVLFVSHNMESVRALTERCLVLDHGQVQLDAPTEDAIQAYLRAEDEGGWLGALRPVEALALERRLHTDPRAAFVSLGLADGAGCEIASGAGLRLHIGMRAQEALRGLTIGYTVRHEGARPVLNGYSPAFDLRAGEQVVALDLHRLELGPGLYDLHLGIVQGGLTDARHPFDILFGAGRFRVTHHRAEGGALPAWNAGWGHVIHTDSAVRTA